MSFSTANIFFLLSLTHTLTHTHSLTHSLTHSHTLALGTIPDYAANKSRRNITALQRQTCGGKLGGISHNTTVVESDSDNNSDLNIGLTEYQFQGETKAKTHNKNGDTKNIGVDFEAVDAELMKSAMAAKKAAGFLFSNETKVE
jgi:hypothetical protein